MEILYLIAIVAVFVLCMALLSTTRRILRSSPLPSEQFDISRVYRGTERPETNPLEEMRGEETAIRDFETGHVELNSLDHLAIVAETAIAATLAPEIVTVETISTEPVCNTFARPMTDALAEEDTALNTAALPRTSNAVQVRKPSRRAYNHAMECLLLGISAWVLIRTQRSTSRNSLRQPSSDRVA